MNYEFFLPGYFDMNTESESRCCGNYWGIYFLSKSKDRGEGPSNDFPHIIPIEFWYQVVLGGFQTWKAKKRIFRKARGYLASWQCTGHVNLYDMHNSCIYNTFPKVLNCVFFFCFFLSGAGFCEEMGRRFQEITIYHETAEGQFRKSSRQPGSNMAPCYIMMLGIKQRSLVRRWHKSCMRDVAQIFHVSLCRQASDGCWSAQATASTCEGSPKTASLGPWVPYRYVQMSCKLTWGWQSSVYVFFGVCASNQPTNHPSIHASMHVPVYLLHLFI